MKRGLHEILLSIDRRIIYCLVALVLAVPIVCKWKMNPGVMSTARKTYDAIEALEAEPGKIVVVALDWGPATKAENEPQTEAVIRHLMLKKLPFAVVTLTPRGVMYCREMPKRLAKEYECEYGRDWVSWGYQPGWMTAVRGLAKDIPGFLKGVDADGVSLDELSAMRGVKDASDVLLVCEFTGLVGAIENWIRYFHAGGKTTRIVHGCTSITIPEAYNFLDARQIDGLLEGMAGGASYNELLRKSLELERWPDAAPVEAMTCQSFAHLLILAFIALGNLGLYLKKRRGEK